MKSRFFKTPAAWRAWLERHHADTKELLVGFYKRDSGKPSITWPESVDQALCFGWIDGVRKRIDDDSYSIRFTPRRATSIWSNVNRKRMKELIAAGLVHQAGLDAFQKRKKQGVYAYEQRDTAKLTPAMEKEFRKHAAAWRWFAAEAPWYRRVVSWWVISAKKDDTKARRLARLIADSAAGRRVGILERP
jgi:uncharacterized protein YdeI (YjbR/CyaY-like superfamily)